MEEMKARHHFSRAHGRRRTGRASEARRCNRRRCCRAGRRGRAYEVAEILHEDKGPGWPTPSGESQHRGRSREARWHASPCPAEDPRRARRVRPRRASRRSSCSVDRRTQPPSAPAGKLRFESRARGELVGVGAAVGVEPRAPVALADDDAFAQLVRVADESFVAHMLREGEAVEALDEEARLLEFDGEEEGRRDVDAFGLAALLRPRRTSRSRSSRTGGRTCPARAPRKSR